MECRFNPDLRHQHQNSSLRDVPGIEHYLGTGQLAYCLTVDAHGQHASPVRMELLTLKAKHTAGTVDVDVVALDDAGVSVACTAQLTKDLRHIHTLVYDEAATVTEELLAFVRAEVSDYIEAHQAELAAMPT
ncbi:MAG TPA: hypothetical protein VNG33_24385 [Polyangiaceae bacterium]|nr:hypothetical protein [Polyangiaceae bacterium]